VPSISNGNIKQTAGNGVVTNQTFDAQTGRLKRILAGGGIVEDFSYTYDPLPNVITRADANENLPETFEYDALNRVTKATVSQNAPVKTFAYDVIGNLLSKSDVGTYTYPLAGSARRHAVTSISNGNINTTFSYDPNGNQTSGLGRIISYTSFNKPSSIVQGSSTLNFSHDIDHQRFKQVSPEGITYYFDAFGLHAELFVSSITKWCTTSSPSAVPWWGCASWAPTTASPRAISIPTTWARSPSSPTRAVPWWSATATTPGASGASPTGRRPVRQHREPDHARLHRPGGAGRCRPLALERPRVYEPADRPHDERRSDAARPR
jgi:hypothetical protein